MEKLTGLAEEVGRKEGWKWAEACADWSAAAELGRVYPVAIERSEADAAEIAALSEEYDRLITETDAAEVLPPEVDMRLEAIDKALQAHGPDYDYTAEAKARAGVMVVLGHDGLARFERGLVRAEDAALAPPPPWDADEAADGDASECVGADSARAGEEEIEPGEGSPPLSERLLIDLTAHKTMGLRDAVQADVAAALATVVHAMALQVFYPGYGDFTPLQLRLSAGGLERLAPGVGDSPAGRRVTDRLEAWGARLPEEAGDLWTVLASICRAELLDLLACCAGVGLHAVRDPHDRRPGAWAQAETLAMAVGLDMTGTWSATAASYFSRVPKARVLEAVTEAVGAEEAGRIVGFKKGDMADAAERLMEGRGWLPTVLRVAPPEQDGEAEVVAGEASSPDAPTSGDAEGTAPTDDGYAFAAE
jgi:ParB family chromosome partitioning protein